MFECEDSGPSIDVEKMPTLFPSYIDKKINNPRGSRGNQEGLEKNLSTKSTGSPDNMAVQINSNIPKSHE